MKEDIIKFFTIIFMILVVSNIILSVFKSIQYVHGENIRKQFIIERIRRGDAFCINQDTLYTIDCNKK